MFSALYKLNRGGESFWGWGLLTHRKLSRRLHTREKKNQNQNKKTTFPLRQPLTEGKRHSSHSPCVPEPRGARASRFCVLQPNGGNSRGAGTLALTPLCWGQPQALGAGSRKAGATTSPEALGSPTPNLNEDSPCLRKTG